MRYEKLELFNDAGQRLGARLDLPAEGAPEAYALFAHCFTCTKNLRAARHIDRALTSRGIAVLRIDFTGLGESEGDPGETNLSTRVEDLVAAARLLEARYEAPRLLLGHSMGGAAVLLAAARIPSARAVVTLGAASRADHLLEHFVEAVEELDAGADRVLVNIGGSPFPLTRRLVDDLRARRVRDAAAALEIPLLVAHAPEDEVVPFAEALALFQAATPRASFLGLAGADHLLSREADALYAGAAIAAWARRPMGLDERVPDSPMRDSRVAARIERDRYRTDILAGGHRLVADEPVASGGTGLGPSPYELALAGLGACTAMTLRMYADRKGWPLEAVDVRLRHEKIHADDVQGEGRAAGRIDLIERELRLEGDLEPEQRARLADIADRCPVHRTLTSEIRIRTEISWTREARD